MVLGLFALGAAWDLWQIHRPARGWSGVTPPSVAAPAAPGHGNVLAVPNPDAGGRSQSAPAPSRIDLNRADARELDQLPGIGPVLAGRIVEHRRLAGPYRSVEDLLAVRGIGPALFERLRGRVVASAADSVPGRTHDRGSSTP